MTFLRQLYTATFKNKHGCVFETVGKEHMQTKRFVAADMRRALSLVRDDLGEDAMIISTQRTAKGVEIIATIEDVLQPPMTRQSPLPTTPVNQKPMEKKAIGLASGKTQDELAQELDAARGRMLAMQESQKDNLTLTEWADQQTSFSQRSRPSASSPFSQNTSDLSQTAHNKTSSAPAPVASATEKDNKEIKRLHEEISSMRSLLENQLMAMSATQERQYQEQKNAQAIIPVAAHVKQRLSNLGLTQACNDQVIRSLRMVDDKSMDETVLWNESLARLSRSIPAIMSDPVATGGIYAFLGTTGVGKTTTIAKLAARYVIEHGAEQVALLTTDTFRIGAHDQLRSLGRILNVQVKVVDHLQELPEILKTFSKQALVLIDTPGMSYNDPLLSAHLNALSQCHHVQTSLVISANSQYQMMQASLHSYRVAKPRFCVMTKLDECVSLGDAISLLASNDLPLAYITDGQSVPDDLSILKPHQLLAKAVTLSKLESLGAHKKTSLTSSKNPA
ncbi:MAG: flagellar biosynthesis protein FlhF [Cellvibrionaceae bacterium]|jgi:flagellar biosynthesis protein FlhF